MRPIIFNFGDNDRLFQSVAEDLGADLGIVERRTFPDGESYIRFETDCKGREAILICSLDRPDAKVLSLVLAADTLHDLGATRVSLIAPYLAYMRQDSSFQPGEGITARYFAKLLSRHFDWLVTVDPHLHRFRSLDEIYTIPTTVVRAAPLLASWITNNVAKPVLIGPDSESKQWVADVAARANAPALILKKIRTGDHTVRISVPKIEAHRERTPIIIDDIISTGRTMVATIEHLVEMKMAAPVCIAVHGVFAEGAADLLSHAGATRVVTCNTIEDKSNAIDVSSCIAAAAGALDGTHINSRSSTNS